MTTPTPSASSSSGSERASEAARVGAVAPLPGWLAFACSGRDAVDLLGRLSTNDLAPLGAGRSVSSLFLSPTGRLLHRVLLLPEPALDRLLALAEPGSEGFPDWIDRYTFGEDCRVELLAGHRAVALFGPGGLATLPNPLESPGDLAIDREVSFARRDWGPLAVAIGTGPEAAIGEWVARRCAELPRLDAGDLLQLRVECGEPASGAEITEERFPLEAGLVGEISFTKGCYTGQEVVARQDAYGKVTRRLVGLAFAQPPRTGDVLTSEGKDGCRLTSVAPQPVALGDGSVVHAALGYALARTATAGRAVTMESGLEGRIVELPFQ